MLLTDFDDFCDDDRSRADLARLDQLRAMIPTFCATLFTIPGRCSAAFVEWMKETRPWLDLVPHGWMHNDNYEARDWTKYECKEALRRAREIGITTRGFKAPGWQISDGCYGTLLDEGYWVADQDYNHARRNAIWGPEPSAYVIINGKTTDNRWSLCETDKNGDIRVGTAIHGHIGHLGGHNANALELIMPQIIEAAKVDTDFKFINEVMR